MIASSFPCSMMIISTSVPRLRFYREVMRRLAIGFTAYMYWVLGSGSGLGFGFGIWFGLGLVYVMDGGRRRDKI